jgi:hypothetical protein
MVIDNFNIVRLPTLKTEADAPLVVDPDAPLSDAVSGQRFEAVGWRHAKVVENHDRIQLGQSLDRPLQDVGGKMSGFPRGEKAFSFGVRECPNHGLTCKHFVYDCQAQNSFDFLQRRWINWDDYLESE